MLTKNASLQNSMGIQTHTHIVICISVLTYNNTYFNVLTELFWGLWVIFIALLFSIFFKYLQKNVCTNNIFKI